MGRLAVVALATLAPCAGCSILIGTPMRVEHSGGVLPTGVVWRDTFTGIGRVARPDDVVELHWTAQLEDGTEVDSTYDRGVPEVVDLGDPPILGLADGAAGMREGGRRRIVVPPHRAYGHVGRDEVVPPDATIVLEVELLAVRRGPEDG